jgi:O-antigen/teichoic acid export membrane protein
MILGFSLFNFLALPGINLFYCIDKTYFVYVITFVSQLVGFIIYYSLRNIVPNRMILLCAAIYGTPFLVNLLSVIALQFKENVLVKYKLGLVEFKFLKDILGNSINFFFIQIASIVQFQVGNFLISTHFPSQKVTEYNSYNKYFSIMQILLSVIVTPYWISFAKFKGQNDLPGLKNEFKKFSFLILGLIAALIVQFFMGNIVFKIWLHDKILYDYTIAFFFMLYYVFYFIGVIFVIFVNATLNVKWQMYTSFISVLLFLYLFNVTSPIFGIAGIAISLIAANFYGVTVAPIQVFRYFKSTKSKKVSLS